MCLAAMQKKNFSLGSLSKEVGDLLAFVGPLALNGIVAFVTDKAEGRATPSFGGMALGYWCVIASCVASVLQSLALHHSYQAFIRAGIQSKQAVSLAIYQKSTRISAAQRQAIGAGKIQNLMSNDANAVNMAWNFVNYGWATVIQVALCMVLLYKQLGVSSFVALGVLLCLIPVQARQSGEAGGRMGGSHACTSQPTLPRPHAVLHVRLHRPTHARDALIH
jgi:hypothetical protein